MNPRIIRHSPACFEVRYYRHNGEQGRELFTSYALAHLFVEGWRLALRSTRETIKL